MKKKLLTIAANTYYAEKFIVASLNRFRNVAKEIRENFELDVEIVIVDDGSKDNTVKILNEEYNKNKDFRFVKLTKNFGAVSSYRAGIEIAKGDAVVFLASDLQDPPEVIPQLVSRWLNGNKFIYCPRQKRADPIISKIFSKVYYLIFNKISQIKNFPKTGFDTCLMDRQVVDAFVSCKEKNYAPQQLIWWLGFESLALPINREKRQFGKSGWTLSKKITLAIDTVISMSYFPIRAISVFGILIAFSSISYGIYILYQAIFGSISVAGWSSIICIISFLLGVVMVMLGIIGEYLWRILETVKNRPSYIVDYIRE